METEFPLLRLDKGKITHATVMLREIKQMLPKLKAQLDLYNCDQKSQMKVSCGL